MTVRRYTKRPVTIEAVQLTQYGEFVRTAAWINENGGKALFSPAIGEGCVDTLIISTLEGDMEATKGSWVIRGLAGEFYPCKAEIFAASYEQETPDAVIEGETKGSTYVRQTPTGGQVLSAEATA